MNFRVRLVHNPLLPDPWSAYAYTEDCDPNAQFLPGATFTGIGETEEAAIANLKQRMKLWKTRQEEYWMPMLVNDNGETIGLAA